MRTQSDIGTLYILAAGICWGFIGLFVKNLYRLGLTPPQIVFYRMLLGTLMLTFFMLIKNPALFKITRKTLGTSILIGLICQMLFNFSYFKSIELNSLSTAAILMYTAPALAAVIARVVYRELLTPRKIVAIAICLSGCFLTVTGGHISLGALNPAGILFGISSGIAYAMFPIFGRSVSTGNSPLALTFYSMLFGTLFFFPLAAAQNAVFFEVSFQRLGNLGLLALVSTVLPYIFYYTGMSKGIEASKAGIISSVEVAVAVLLSLAVFGEELADAKMAGILLVFLSIFILQTNMKLIFAGLGISK